MAELELCSRCDQPTGRAGRCEDSLYVGPVGPFCEDCHPDAIDEAGDAWDCESRLKVEHAAEVKRLTDAMAEHVTRASDNLMRAEKAERERDEALVEKVKEIGRRKEAERERDEIVHAVRQLCGAQERKWRKHMESVIAAVNRLDAKSAEGEA